MKKLSSVLFLALFLSSYLNFKQLETNQILQYRIEKNTRLQTINKTVNHFDLAVKIKYKYKNCSFTHIELFHFLKQLEIVSKYYKIDFYTLLGWIATESEFNANAYNKSGCYGLLQLKKIACKDINANFERMKSEPLYNIKCGIEYLIKQNESSFYKYNLGATAYNKGIRNNYVSKINRNKKLIEN